jgi:hypothetical protein
MNNALVVVLTIVCQKTDEKSQKLRGIVFSGIWRAEGKMPRTRKWLAIEFSKILGSAFYINFGIFFQNMFHH